MAKRARATKSTTKHAKASRGSQLLGKYLAEHELSLAEFAELAGCSKSFAGFLKQGASRPGLDLATHIESITDGAVPATAWTKAP